MGFTLIEMAVVLSIIGLIVGSVLIGKTIIHNGEMISIVTDMERYKKAVYTFKQKYNELPGDFSAAEATWGTDAPCPDVMAKKRDAPQVATCNGNGDGMIAFDPLFIDGTDSWEMLRLWQHLANADLIEGKYSGTVTTLGALHPDVNLPTSRFKHGVNGFVINFMGQDSGGGFTFAADYGHVIIYSKMFRLNPADPVEYALSPADAMDIDQKIDDGQPHLGKLLMYMTGSADQPQCVIIAGGVTTYNTAVSTLSCRLLYITGW
jgi:prepilin-type N-terminal cleavage/methylation domain-containing protein